MRNTIKNEEGLKTLFCFVFVLAFEDFFSGSSSFFLAKCVQLKPMNKHSTYKVKFSYKT